MTPPQAKWGACAAYPQTYCEAAAKVGDPKLAELLTKLAEQEVAHVAWFTELRETLPPSEVK